MYVVHKQRILFSNGYIFKLQVWPNLWLLDVLYGNVGTAGWLWTKNEYNCVLPAGITWDCVTVNHMTRSVPAVAPTANTLHFYSTNNA